MDLRMRLKEETQYLHDKIEKTSLFKKIMQQEITLSDYQLIIRKLYGFITPCDELIGVLNNQLGMRHKTMKSWLEQDLRALNLSDKDDSTCPRCLDLPSLTEKEQILGYLYVMQGATLGGQIITKMIKTQLRITQDKGGRFFYGYGDDTLMMWNEFCALLSSIKDTEQQNKIIHAASNTFNQLYKWMEAT